MTKIELTRGDEFFYNFFITHIIVILLQCYSVIMVLSVSHGIGIKHTVKQEAYLTVWKWHKYTTDMNKQLYFFLDIPLPNGRIANNFKPSHPTLFTQW